MPVKNGRVLNIADARLPAAKKPEERELPPLLVVSGTGMDTGKTLFLSTLIQELSNDGLTIAGGKLTGSGIHNGTGGSFHGTSDLEVAPASGTPTITYALFINGVLKAGAETPHVFNVLNKIENISIIAPLILDRNDYIEIHVKSSVAGVTVTSKTLSILYDGK